MRLAVHNVVQLTDADVRGRFVVRHRELDELLAHLHDGDPPRHALVIGRRGMGKSLLLRRVAVTVADDAGLAARWLPVILPEEVYDSSALACEAGFPARCEQSPALMLLQVELQFVDIRLKLPAHGR